MLNNALQTTFCYKPQCSHLLSPASRHPRTLKTPPTTLNPQPKTPNHFQPYLSYIIHLPQYLSLYHVQSTKNQTNLARRMRCDRNVSPARKSKKKSPFGVQGKISIILKQLGFALNCKYLQFPNISPRYLWSDFSFPIHLPAPLSWSWQRQWCSNKFNSFI